jgi:hypothetical protein
MRTASLFLLMFFAPIFLCAQKNIVKKTWAITLAPSIIPLPGNQQIGIQTGMAYQFKPRLEALAGVTFNAGKRNDKDTMQVSYLDKKYFRISAELRYYSSKDSSGQGAYIGLLLSYTGRNFVSKYSYYYDHLPDDSVIYFDRATINSPIATISIQFGVKLPISKSFQSDWFLGLGVRGINTEYTGVLNPRQSEKFEPTGGFRISWPDPAYYYPDFVYKLHINLGVRLFYIFHRS